MGFPRNLTSEEDQESEINQSFQEFKKENDPLDHSLTNAEDISESFVDSLLDFEFLRDWMASDDLGENPVQCGSEKVQLDANESLEMKFDEVLEKNRVEEGGELESLGDMSQENGENMNFDKVEVEEESIGDGCGKEEDLRCLIEEEMGKFSLDGVSTGSLIGGAEGCSYDIVGSLELESLVQEGGVDHGVLASDGGNRAEMVSIDKSGEKSGEQGSDRDESDDDSESEDESESSSSSSTSSSSDDDDEEEEEEKDKKPKAKGGMQGGKHEEAGEEGVMDMEEGEIVTSDVGEMVAWSDDEDGGGEDVPKGPIRSKNEIIVLPPVPPVNVTLQPHHQTLPVGAVLSIMGSQVVVEGIEKHRPLSDSSILWLTDSRSPLGIVDEIFGPVKNPYYIIRYNSETEVPSGIQPGTAVSFVQEFADHILNDKSLYQKGYDASGANDEEVFDEEEFSDDEKEAEYRKMMKMKKRGTNDEKVGNKKNDKKKFKNQPGNWKTDQTARPQGSSWQGNVPVNHNKHPVPPVMAPPGQGNVPSSSGFGQGSAGQPGMRPPFDQMGMNPGFNNPSGPGNGIPFQQPQNMMGFPWMQQLHPRPMYQMPMQSGFPYQQQIGAGSNIPPNMVLSGAQPGFGALPGFLPCPALLNQGMFNQPSFGMMGTPAQRPPLPVNMGEQAMPSNNMPQTGFNPNFQPDNAVSGNFNTSPGFNRGRHSGGGGRKPHRRGGGRFGGGRGRHQSG